MVAILFSSHPRDVWARRRRQKEIMPQVYAESPGTTNGRKGIPGVTKSSAGRGRSRRGAPAGQEVREIRHDAKQSVAEMSGGIPIGAIGDAADLHEPEAVEARSPGSSAPFPRNAEGLGFEVDLLRPDRIHDVLVPAGDGPEVDSPREFVTIRDGPQLVQEAGIRGVARQGSLDKAETVVVLDRGGGHDKIPEAGCFRQTTRRSHAEERLRFGTAIDHVLGLHSELSLPVSSDRRDQSERGQVPSFDAVKGAVRCWVSQNPEAIQERCQFLMLRGQEQDRSHPRSFRSYPFEPTCIARDGGEFLGDPYGPSVRRGHRAAEDAGRAREEKDSHPSGRRLEKIQRPRHVGLDEEGLRVRSQMRLVKGRGMDDGAEAPHGIPHEVAVGNGADEIRPGGGHEVQAGDSMADVAQVPHQRLSQMATTPGDEDVHGWPRSIADGTYPHSAILYHGVHRGHGEDPIWEAFGKRPKRESGNRDHGRAHPARDENNSRACLRGEKNSAVGLGGDEADRGLRG